MEYLNIKGLDKKLSKMVLGTAYFLETMQEEHNKTLDDALEAGINVFDTAALYTDGQSESVLGKWMKSRGVEDKVAILSKGAHYNAYRKRVTPFDILADIHDSFARLDVDCIDIYLLHRDDPNVPVATIVDCLNRLYEDGKIRVFGGSNWTHRRIEEANEYAYKYGLEPFRASSPNYSLCVQNGNPWGDDCVTLSGDNEALEFYKKNQMPIFAYAALANGFLSGGFAHNEIEKAPQFMEEFSLKGYVIDENVERLRRSEIIAEKYGVSVPQVALAWVLRQNLKTFTIVRSDTKERLLKNVQAIEIQLTDEEVRWLGGE